MKIRIDHIIVAIIVITVLILIMYLLNSTFINNYNKKNEKYITQFNEIELELKNNNFDKVKILSRQVLSSCESGNNDIKAQSYLGISSIKLGQVEEASEILSNLIVKYPGIKMAYSEIFEIDRSEDSLLLIFNSILSDYIKNYKDAINKQMTLFDIFNAMDIVDWARLLAILFGSIALYEIIISKKKKKVTTHDIL